MSRPAKLVEQQSDTFLSIEEELNRVVNPIRVAAFLSECILDRKDDVPHSHRMHLQFVVYEAEASAGRLKAQYDREDGTAAEVAR